MKTKKGKIMIAKDLYLQTALSLIKTSGYRLPYILRKPSPLKRECLLPGCEKITTHNGGYCSAELCKQHRLLLKGKI